jgi:hypothetical protein
MEFKMEYKELILKVLADADICDWFQTEIDHDIVEIINDAPPDELRTYGLDAIGDTVDMILESGIDAGLITEEDIENADN